MQGEAHVEVEGGIVVARVRGEPTAGLLHECQERVLALVREGGLDKVLYDAREMEPPPVDVPWAQRELDARLGALALRRAVVVPSTKLAYLARLAFAGDETRVFYDDLAAATSWLEDDRVHPAR